jgi:hypothetical protein
MKVAERSKIEVISSTGHQAKVIIPGQVVEPSPKIPPLDERLLKPAPYTSTRDGEMRSDSLEGKDIGP